TRPLGRIPLSVCLSLNEPASANLSNTEDSYDIKEVKRISRADYLGSIQKLHSLFRSIYQQKLSKNNSDTSLNILFEIEHASKRTVANISDKNDSFGSLP
ncbi:hypothetical protein EDC96DRAFT_446030, partial [Choanephora cucurbitarum]